MGKQGIFRLWACSSPDCGEVGRGAFDPFWTLTLAICTLRADWLELGAGVTVDGRPISAA